MTATAAEAESAIIRFIFFENRKLENVKLFLAE